MTQQTKVLATHDPRDLSSVSRIPLPLHTHIKVEGENQPYKVFPDPTSMLWHLYAYTHTIRTFTHNKIKIILKKMGLGR